MSCSRVTTLAIAFNWLGALQRDVPGYTTALEDHVESVGSACTQLRQLSGEHQNQFAAANARLEGKKATCASTDSGQSQSGRLAAGATPTTPTTTTTVPATSGNQKPPMFTASKTDLPNLGRAPNFTGITAWFNTPGDQPLSLSQLRGKVVLVDFWTYSCINCQRALPHVEGWYNDYRKDGLVVVGVSAPEFAFEHVVSNVESAAGHLGIDYPVAVDDNLATWNAYNNEYWPADYLIDPNGTVRAYDFGEGGYGQMESNIRMLLSANGVTDLPARTDVPDRTPTSPDRPRRVTSGTSACPMPSGPRWPTTAPSPTTRRPPSPRTASPSVANGPSTARRRRRAATPRSGCNSRPTTSTWS